MDQVGGVLGEDHTMSGGYCTKCGYGDGSGGGDIGGGDVDDTCYHYYTYYSWYGCTYYEYCSDCGAYISSGTSHGSTYTEWDGCEWYEYCRDCDELMDYGTSHGSYVYDDWEYYNSSRHRRYYHCSDCGEGSYSYGYHSTSNKYTSYSSTQHQVGSYCSTCATYIGSTSYESHNFTYGPWTKSSGSQHRRSATCSDCGYTTYEYAGHSLTYGDWTDYSDTQHRRNGTCGDCSYTTTEYAGHNPEYGDWWEYSDTEHIRLVNCFCGYQVSEYAEHTDADYDGFCDGCGYLMSRFSVTVPAVMLIVLAEDGSVYTAANAAITNNSTASVMVTKVTITAGSGWTIVPYHTEMADEKVDSRLIGFLLNDAVTSDTGYSENLSLASNWTVTRGNSMDLLYDAVVSATSEIITEEQVLTIVFVLDWARD